MQSWPCGALRTHDGVHQQSVADGALQLVSQALCHGGGLRLTAGGRPLARYWTSVTSNPGVSAVTSTESDARSPQGRLLTCHCHLKRFTLPHLATVGDGLPALAELKCSMEIYYTSSITAKVGQAASWSKVCAQQAGAQHQRVNCRASIHSTDRVHRTRSAAGAWGI